MQHWHRWLVLAQSCETLSTFYEMPRVLKVCQSPLELRGLRPVPGLSPWSESDAEGEEEGNQMTRGILEEIMARQKKISLS